MMTYISLLRGINVSGKNLIKMETLIKIYETLGFISVRTYLQSGNVIFNSPEEDQMYLSDRISNGIKNDTGIETHVIVLNTQQLSQIIRDNPFKDDLSKEPSFLHITFLAKPPDLTLAEAIYPKKLINEDVHISGQAVYLFCPHGYGKTKLTNNFLESKLRVNATTRNWKTSNELLKISM